MSIKLRTAEGRDAAAIARVHVRTWQAAYRGLLPDSYLRSLDAELDERTARWEGFIDAAAARRQTQIVAVDDEQVVGFVTFGPSDEHPHDGRSGEVYAIYVQPSHWDRGYGRALFTAAQRGLAAAGFETATLWVLATNGRARRFYELAGWTVDGATKTDRRRSVVLHEVRYRSQPLQTGTPAP
ncbi:MAG TPA: GNAT family N-acetyltransferase [Candidatus Limnocylindria bacterium]|nr:GNAT family N-acetyltransferase [Candidatus Limnocylindria bacterium]